MDEIGCPGICLEDTRILQGHAWGWKPERVMQPQLAGEWCISLELGPRLGRWTKMGSSYMSYGKPRGDESCCLLP